MTISPQELDALLTLASEVGMEAGRLLLGALGQAVHVQRKGAVDLVTEYDRQAEALIVEHLTRQRPDIGILAEESGESDPTGGQTRWIIDPLDGTTNFAHGQPFFAVSIGLEHEGEQVVGAIAIPALSQCYRARKGGGATCNGERISVSQTRRLNDSLIATGFPYDRRTAQDDNIREFRAFMKRSQGMRRCGAAAVDLAFVGRGVYDGFFEPKLHPWDLAAGVVIVREAGGEVTNYDGSPIDIHRGWVVASNGLIHKKMLAVLSTPA